jgi:hypothetical protein
MVKVNIMDEIPLTAAARNGTVLCEPRNDKIVVCWVNWRVIISQAGVKIFRHGEISAMIHDNPQVQKIRIFAQLEREIG